MDASSGDTPIFIRQKINYTPHAPIKQLVSCNNFLVLALKDGKIQTIPLETPSKLAEVEIIPASNRSKDSIAFVHLDPSGEHLIISVESGSDIFYLSSHNHKLVSLSKLKGHVVSAVAWNPAVSKTESTGLIVLGTTAGLLFETEITSNGNLAFLRQIYCVSDFIENSSNLRIISLHLQPCARDVKDNKWLLLFTVPGRLFAFSGVATSTGLLDNSYSLQPLLSSLENSIESCSLVASGSSSLSSADRASQIIVYPLMEPAHRFAWLQSSGVQYGNVDTSAGETLRMICGKKFYSNPSCGQVLNAALTDYHMILLYADRINVVSILNESLAFEDVFGQKFGKLIGICRDPISEFIWVYSDKHVFKYTPNNETRFLWSIYLDQGDYNMARRFAADNPKNLDIVLQKQCSKLMTDKKYIAAAEIYAMTSAPFEDVALKLLQAEDRNALKMFLQRKLDKLDETKRTQKAMIVFWLLEILLTELDEAKSGLSPNAHLSSDDNVGEMRIKGFDPHKTKELREHFRMFLKKVEVMECLRSNPKAAVQIMASHGDIETLLYFSELMKDFDSVITYYIQQERYDDALSVLNKQKNPELFYKHSSALLSIVPQPLIDSWISMGNLLKPKILLTAAFQCEDILSCVDQIIRYFEFCISSLGCNDQAVHNYLLSLYTKYHKEKLTQYLENEGKDINQIRYDLKFALRTCIDKGLSSACVHLYCVMEMYEEAMSLALKVDVNLAKNCAKIPADNEMRRKLWLIFARNVIEKDKDIKNCVALLQESEGLLKIQDLLPFFPDFATIDHFKESLCDCLSEHSGTIKNLQQEMKEATEVAEQIQNEIQTARHKYVILKTKEKCSSCNQMISTRDFFAFQCRHNFHQDCIEKELTPLLDEETKLNLQDLKRRLQLSSAAMNDDSVSIYSGTSGHESTSKREEILAEVDEILASECPLCGDISLRYIDLPFYTPFEYAAELKKWD